MGQKKHTDPSGRQEHRNNRVLRQPSGHGKSGRHLDLVVDTALKNWNTYESTFLTRCEENGFVLKLMTLAHDEECRTRVIKQHGGTVSLLGVYGRAKKFARERLLGYILLFAQNPIIHEHTWFVAIGYSDMEDIRRKDPTLIAYDDNIRLFRAGVGTCDYLFCYKAKKRKHDEAGFSNGAVYLETEGQWKDGL